MVSIGSVGDILALIQLAATITQALSKSSGASKEYQEVIAEIDALAAGLKTLRANIPTAAGPNRMQPSVENAIRYSLAQCHFLMKDFMRSIEGYKALSRKRGMARDVWRKIGWGLFKKEELVTLRTQLAQQKTAITLMLAFANNAAANAHTTVLERIESGSQQQDILAFDISRDVQRQSVSINDILRLIERMPQTLGYTWEGSNRQPVWFVDSVGQKVAFPIELLLSYRTLMDLLRLYVKDRPGQKLVEQGDYELLDEDDLQLKHLGSANWNSRVRPGALLYILHELHRFNMPSYKLSDCRREHGCTQHPLDHFWLEYRVEVDPDVSLVTHGIGCETQMERYEQLHDLEKGQGKFVRRREMIFGVY